MPDLKVAPPEIEDYTYRRHLGSGGFSEVFVYEDLRLGREVAVKVLTEGASDDEARVMASVASHTHIVDVYSVGVIDGSPYLVMQLYSGPTFAQRIRSGPLRHPEVLQLGVQLCGALEWAHRLGVLHRDIKPANILTSGTGRPGLADFGISTSGGLKSEQTGVSLPWVPPEVLQGQPADELADVYSLAATLYTLCAGHAPFVVPGGDNRDQVLMARTLKDVPPTLTETEVPRSLNSLLRSALSKDPDARPTSAAAFGRALQGIEAELRLAQTPLEIPTTAPPPVDRTDAADATRSRGVRVIDANPSNGPDESTRARRPTESGMIASPNGSSPFVGGRRRVVAAPAHEPGTPATAIDDDVAGSAATRSRRRWPWAAAAASLALVVVVIVVGGDDGNSPEGPEEVTFSDTDPTLPEFVPKVVDLTAARMGSGVRVTWTAPADDVTEFVWTRCEEGAARIPNLTNETVLELEDVPPGADLCVTAERDGATSDEVRVTLP